MNTLGPSKLVPSPTGNKTHICLYILRQNVHVIVHPLQSEVLCVHKCAGRMELHEGPVLPPAAAAHAVQLPSKHLHLKWNLHALSSPISSVNSYLATAREARARLLAALSPPLTVVSLINCLCCGGVYEGVYISFVFKAWLCYGANLASALQRKDFCISPILTHGLLVKNSPRIRQTPQSYCTHFEEPWGTRKFHRDLAAGANCGQRGKAVSPCRSCDDS
eukprot:scaffold294865_cov17-Tisochrysis_lutea.AAC.1